MKEPGERGQAKNPPQKKQKRLTTLIVQAGIARSVREAQEMLAASEICVYSAERGRWSTHGNGKRSEEPPAEFGRMMLDEDAQVMHRSKCSECAHRPIVFTKKDKKPAISSTTHALVEEGRDYECPSSDSTLIRQEDLELWILRRRQFTEIDEPIAVALSKGAKIEPGIHTAELLPMRNEDGSVHLKLVIR